MIDYEQENNSKFESLPKVGEKKTFEIVRAEKVEGGDPRFNFKSKKEVLVDGQKATVEVDAGYRYDFHLKNGKILSVSNWSTWYAFLRAQVNDGMVIDVNHPVKGEWDIKLVGPTTW